MSFGDFSQSPFNSTSAPKMEITSDQFTCKNGCDLTYFVDGEKYSHLIFHKMLNNGIGDHWDCPKCTANCGMRLLP